MKNKTLYVGDEKKEKNVLDLTGKTVAFTVFLGVFSTLIYYSYIFMPPRGLDKIIFPLSLTVILLVLMTLFIYFASKIELLRKTIWRNIFLFLLVLLLALVFLFISWDIVILFLVVGLLITPLIVSNIWSKAISIGYAKSGYLFPFLIAIIAPAIISLNFCWMDNAFGGLVFEGYIRSEAICRGLGVFIGTVVGIINAIINFILSIFWHCKEIRTSPKRKISKINRIKKVIGATLLVSFIIFSLCFFYLFVLNSSYTHNVFSAQIRAELSRVRINAESYYYRDGHYTGYDESDGWNRIADKVPACSRSIMSDLGYADEEYQIRIDDGGDPDYYAQKYLAWAPLCGTDPQLYYCIDYIGNAMEVSIDPATEENKYDCRKL